MNKIITILFFLVCTLHVLANDSKIDFPKLNLEIGKTYTIETIHHMDTSEVWQRRVYDQRRYKITPVRYDSTYKLFQVMMLVDFHKYSDIQNIMYRHWVEYKSYQTNFESSHKSFVSWLDRNKVPIYFHVMENGRVLNFRYDTDDNQMLNISDKYYKINRKKDFEADVQQLFFQKPNQKIGRNNPDGSKGIYALTQRKKTLEALYTPSSTKASKPNSMQQSKWVIDRGTGLVFNRLSKYKVPQRDFAEYLVEDGVSNIEMRYQRLINIYPNVSKGLKSTQYIEKQPEKPNVRIKFKVGDKDSINNFYVLAVHNGTSLSNYSFDPNSENYEISLRVEDVATATIYPIRQSFVISPGDDITCHINSEMELVDKVVYKNRFFQIPEIAAKSLKNKRDLYPPDIYLYDYHSKMYGLNAVKRSEEPNSSDFLFVNSLATNLSSYYLFLKGVISNHMKALDFKLNVDKNQNNDAWFYVNDETLFHYGGQSFSGATRAHFLDYLLHDYSNFQYNLANRINHFRVFEDRYPYYQYLDKLKSVYTYLNDTKPGVSLANKEFKSVEGRVYKISDFKGKCVVINYTQFTKGGIRNKDGKVYNRILFSQRKNFEYFNNKDVIFINFIRNHEYHPEMLTDTFPSNFINCKLPENEFPAFGWYFVLSNTFRSMFENFLVLDKNGTIVKQKFFEKYSHVIIIDDIEKVLSEKRTISESRLITWLKILLIIIVALVILTSIAIKVIQSRNKRRLQKAELNKRMRELELTAIRSQMNPHFMYNCLNSIQNLVQKKQNDEAHLYLSKFASLIRFTLNQSAKSEISLHDELESVDQYIELEKLRFDFEYITDFDVKLDAYSIMVPPMLLQPFVENAILHGLAPKEEDRRLMLSTQLLEKRICITIEDNGIGRTVSAENKSNGNGKGIGFTRERLKLLSEKYNTEFNLEIVDVEDESDQTSGTRVEICFGDEV